MNTGFLSFNTLAIYPVKTKTQGGNSGSSVNVLLQLFLDQQPLTRNCPFSMSVCPLEQNTFQVSGQGLHQLSGSPRCLLFNQSFICLLPLLFNTQAFINKSTRLVGLASLSLLTSRQSLFTPLYDHY